MVTCAQQYSLVLRGADCQRMCLCPQLVPFAQVQHHQEFFQHLARDRHIDGGAKVWRVQAQALDARHRAPTASVLLYFFLIPSAPSPPHDPMLVLIYFYCRDHVFTFHPSYLFLFPGVHRLGFGAQRNPFTFIFWDRTLAFILSISYSF